jgi:hypothetical protein
LPFTLFSKRTNSRSEVLPYTYDSVPEPLRVQIWKILEKAFGTRLGAPPACWRATCDILREELGTFALSRKPRQSEKEECFYFFVSESDASGALDFIDVAFQIIDRHVRTLNHLALLEAGVQLNADQAIQQLNYRLDEHHLGYQFTDGELMRRDSELAHA